MRRWIALVAAVGVLVAMLPGPVRAQTVVQFWVPDLYDRTYYRVGLTQKYVSSRCRVYGGMEVTTSQAQQVGQACDDIYNDVTVLGMPPDVDGDPLIYILILDIRDVYTHDPMAVSFVRAFFDPVNGRAGTYSNGREIIYLDNGQQSPTEPAAKRALAHELGRMIAWGHDPDEERWLVEGVGFLAERVAGFGHRPEVSVYLADPSSRPLTGWTGSAGDVGAAYLLLLYVYEQFGAGAIRRIVADPANGLEAVAAAVGLSPDGLFRRWALANYLDSSGIHRYASLDIVGSDEDNVTRFRRPPATPVARPGQNEKRILVGTLCSGGVRYYRTLPGGRTDPFLRVEDERAMDPEWYPTLEGGFGASWMKAAVLLQEGRIRHTSANVPAGDTYLLCVSPYRSRGAADYRYALHGTYVVFLPLVAKNH